MKRNPVTSPQFEYFPDADAAEETHDQQREQPQQHHVGTKHFNFKMCTTNLFCPAADAFILRILPALFTHFLDGKGGSQSVKITN